MGDAMTLYAGVATIPLDGWYVGDVPIVVDVPAHLAPFGGLSARVRVVNVSDAKRAMEGLR